MDHGPTPCVAALCLSRHSRHYLPSELAHYPFLPQAAIRQQYRATKFLSGSISLAPKTEEYAKKCIHDFSAGNVHCCSCFERSSLCGRRLDRNVETESREIKVQPGASTQERDNKIRDGPGQSQTDIRRRECRRKGD